MHICWDVHFSSPWDIYAINYPKLLLRYSCSFQSCIKLKSNLISLQSRKFCEANDFPLSLPSFWNWNFFTSWRGYSVYSLYPTSKSWAVLPSFPNTYLKTQTAERKLTGKNENSIDLEGNNHWRLDPQEFVAFKEQVRCTWSSESFLGRAHV